MPEPYPSGYRTDGLSLSAELRRTVAMITVGIDGSRLAAGVSIVPRRISLHRVPVQCYLGMANKPYEDETLGIEEIGEQKATAAVPELADGRGGRNASLLTRAGSVVGSLGRAPYAGGHYAGDDGSLDVSTEPSPRFSCSKMTMEAMLSATRMVSVIHASNVHFACQMAGEWGNLLEDRSLHLLLSRKSRRCICAGIPMVQPDTGEPSGSASSWGRCLPELRRAARPLL